MCGRFTTTIDLDEIARHFKINNIEGEYSPLFNAAPTQSIPIVLDAISRKLTFYRWGLIPSWAKDKSIGNKLINARSETLMQKPSFRRLYTKRRCLIAADSFFEWKKEGKQKLPYRILMKNHSPFAMAGLWDAWVTPEGLSLYSCCIITTKANSLIENIHNRMPVILNPSDYDLWLNTTIHDNSLLDHLLTPYPAEFMISYRVSTLINSPLNNTPDIIKAI
jgi:putative SOS response-associated peptidase YedK